MRLRLAIKTLFRSPLKTLLTFVLLAAASFLLIYNISDYALTIREFERVVTNYKGVCNVQYTSDSAAADPWRPQFLLSEATNPANYDGFFSYETFHQQSLSAEDVDMIAAMPHLTAYTPRYMTAGISSDFYRTDRQGMNSYTQDVYFNHADRIVFEATLTGVEYNPLYMITTASIAGYGKPWTVSMRDVELLAGNPDWLSMLDAGAPEGQYRMTVITPVPNFYDLTTRMVEGASSRAVLYYRNNHITVEDMEQLVRGQRYIIVARVDSRRSPNGGYPYLLLGDDTLYNWWPYFYPLEGQPENYLELDEFSPLRDLIQITNDDLHTFDVVYSDDMSTIRRITDGKLYITQGRMLTPEDTAQNKPVCVVSDTMLREYGLDVGDTFSLRLGDRLFEQYAPLGAVASTQGRYADSFTDDIDFEIVGAFVDMNMDKMRETDLYWAYSDNTVFVPLSFLPVDEQTLSEHEFKPAELSFVIGDARNIQAFVDECIPKLEEMGFTVYFSDGGWPSIERHLMRSEILTVIKLLAFATATALAMLLTVYLFIGHKRREFAIMRALGTTKRKARRSLFVPLFLLAIAAISLGGAAAALYADFNAADSLKDFTKLGLEVNTSIPLSVIVCGILSELFLLVLFTLFGLYRISRKPPLVLLQDNNNRGGKSRKKKTVPVLPDTSFIMFTPLPTLEPLPGGQYSAANHVSHYIARHARRSLFKSLLSLALAALLFAAMGQFTTMRQAYSDLYHNIEIKARFINGLPLSRAQTVADSGYVHDPYFEYIYRQGEVNYSAAEFIMTNDPSRTIATTTLFLDGYSLDTFTDLREKVCILPQSLMDSLGLQLGDTAGLNELGYLGTLLVYGLYTDEEAQAMYDRRTVTCTVVGAVQGGASTVYIPIAAKDLFLSLIPSVNLDLAEFTLVDYHQADEFRDYAKGMTDTSGITTTPIFLMDTSEADNIYMIYRLIETLYPIAAVAAILIGGLLPGLIILQSAREAAILRVLGTTKKRTRAMLILEQLFLCLLGLSLAGLLLFALNGVGLLSLAVPLTLYATLHFAACLLGASLAALAVSRRKILELLQVKE